MDTYRGLTKIEVENRIKAGLVNTNNSVKTKSIKHIVVDNICTLFNLVNLMLAFTLFIMQSYKNMLFMGVVCWNAFIGIFQEIRAKIIMDKLSLLTAPTTTVIRDGKEESVLIDEIVCDDICIFRNGNQISSDSVILEGFCEVNESLITGESEPVCKKKGDEILSGSYLVSGKVVAKVIHVGNDNYANIITNGVKHIKKITSEIYNSTKKFIKIITFFIGPIYALNFIKSYFLSHESLKRAFEASAAAVIGMIPSGLILLISVVLAVSVIKLSMHKVHVQNMYCIENLARVDVLCLDKTGTITEGRMTVEKVIPVYPTINRAANDHDKNILEIENILGEYIYSLDDNNPTFNAIRDYKKGYEKMVKAVDVVPFSSDKKYSSVQLDGCGTYMFGAAEVILNTISDDLANLISEYEKQGKRVVLLAKKEEVMIPYAIIVLSDVIRSNAPEILKYFKEQGVELKIISGDNVVAVSNIARLVGVPNYDNYVDATTLDTDEKIIDAALKYTIFGRVTPNQKLKIVKALKDNKYTVGMTGDGVNDVLALKEADCSIAMQSGSDAARNVSDIVLMESDFSVMPEIVNEGRRTINNLERSSSIFLTKTWIFIPLSFIYLLLPFRYPFEPIQMTLVSALFIGIPSFILALEPNYSLVKGRFLKNVLSKAIPAGVFIVINIMITTLFAYIIKASDTEQTTMIVYSLAIGLFVELLLISRPFNAIRKAMLVVLSIAFIVAIVLFRDFFNVTLLSTKMIIFAVSMLAVLLIVRIKIIKGSNKV